MPFAVADSLAARGIDPVVFALKGACDPAAAARFRHHWISVGQLGRAEKLFRAENCRNLVFIGTLVRPALSEIRLDWLTVRVLGRVWAAFRGGDDHLLSGIGRILEQDGFRMVGIKDVAPDILMPEGCITRAMPDAAATADITRGREVLSPVRLRRCPRMGCGYRFDEPDPERLHADRHRPEQSSDQKLIADV